ncbi:hypothetical protein NDU88_004170 [Pleurodeles waltl]|uniref:Uncharacterized protein n=1 Tax=Pleurodeles waltl TaxID=8319 RepID=A0AAV7MWQ1_PLEWA|nr:hypothetical protein NDU88_004170 [Pleurodeles waltl]
MQGVSGKALADLPGQAVWVKRIACKSSASLRQRVVGRGSGVEMVSAVPHGHCLRVCAFDAHAQSSAGVTRETAEHAQLPLKGNVEHVRHALYERPLREAEEQVSSPQLGQAAESQKIWVGVRAPSVHRPEGMARCGANRLTLRVPVG